ncbi:hypothetical protein RhiirA1_539436 [Rhizophagus irregularis]|uniref:Uncharacterized protein n=1 Tax=Rhizophagus irregularis TaxID=588596 RepID=A0A2I1EKY6_9GLOM|nr:hypothetical protein RhiirA1_539436 [Rhizophagus irregularis]PKY22791.1 hypothetical protein RhiirB3_526040 [Rhizophagus irregularis]
MSKISQSNNKENVFNSVYHRKEYLNHHDPFRNFNENELIHKSQKHIYQNNSSINVSYSLVENYRYENNVYCEKNQPRKHLNKRRPEDKVRNSSQKKNLSNSRKVAPQKYHVKQEHQKFNLLLPSSNNVPSYTPSSPPQSYHIKQEHQEFILPLPSSDNVPLYSQNGSSSRIPIESLLNEFNCFPGMDEVAKEYCSTV